MPPPKIPNLGLEPRPQVEQAYVEICQVVKMRHVVTFVGPGT